MNLILHAQPSTPVGAISGVIDVSPMGAATYTIPIEVVPGTQGMQPNLSIVYNSFGGMGLLGMKWDLQGISAISRCRQVPFFDEKCWPILFNNQEYKYSLDGNRLIYSNSFYATEKEDFTKIFLNLTNGSPNYFTAYTDDGSVIEYGHTPTSKQILPPSQNVMSWHINKITDINGNFMTFDYGGNNSGEIYVTSICYTGNTTTSMPTYANIFFTYKDIPDTLGKNTCFVGGYGMPQTKLLQTITVKYENDVVRKYKFIYNIDSVGYSGERTIHLKKVVLHDAQDTELSTTTIEWEKQYGNMSVNTLDLNNQSFTGYIITGDFNGDGYMDYVAYGMDISGTVWRYYEWNQVSNKFILTKTGTHPVLSNGENCFFFKADLYGNGTDVLMMAQRLSNGKDWEFSTLLGAGISKITIMDYDQLYLGDFDGDGATDILFMMKDEDLKYSFKVYLSSNAYLSNPNLPSPTLNCKVRVGDFRGTGKTDVEIHFWNGDIKYYCYTNGSTGKTFKDITPPGTQSASIYQERYSGDFNGDGITDLLTYDNYTWNLYFGKGDCTYIASSNTPSFGVGQIMIADMDGDGKDDIIQLVGGGVKIHFSKGYIANSYKYTITSHIPGTFSSNPLHYNIVDFNNDGTLDIISKTTNATSTPLIVYLPQGKKFDCVKTITDGMDKKIKLTFQPQYLPAHDFCVSQNIEKKFFQNMLVKMEISNGIHKDFNTCIYDYEGPVFTWLRRSFLGFKSFFCDYLTERKSDFFSFIVDDYGGYNSMHLLLPFGRKIQTYDMPSHFEVEYKIYVQDFGNKRYTTYSTPIEWNRMLGNKSATKETLNNENRLCKKINESILPIRCDRDTAIEGKLLVVTNYFNYKKIFLYGNQKKTVIDTVYTTQQYGPYFSQNPLLEDTLFYTYTRNGNLSSKRKSNKDGTITTYYGDYLTTGVYQTKTVLAPNSIPRTETYTYDSTFRFITSITNALNHTTTFTYDPKTGYKTSETDANGLKTTYKYDAFGNIVRINHPDGTLTKISLHWYSNANIPNACYYKQTETSAKPTLIEYYDLLGREVCRKEDGYYYDTRYYANGRVEKTSYPYKTLPTLDSKKIWNEFTYDDAGRIITEKRPYTHLEYSYNQKEVIITDSLRNTTSSKDYDALGRIVAANDKGGTINYYYQITNNKRHLTLIKLFNKNTDIITDLWGNRISITDPNAGQITYSYNGFNELIQQTDARGDTTSYDYDILGRIAKKQFADTDGQKQTIEYLYDLSDNGIGKLHQIMIDSVVAENFSYDAFSRLTQHEKIIDGNSFTHRYSFNGYSQLDTLTYPSGFQVKYSYTATGKLDKIKDGSNSNLIFQAYSRNEFGALNSCTFGSDLASAYTYNPYGLLTAIKTGNKTYGVEPEEPWIGYDKSIDPDELLEEENEPVSIPFNVDGSILNYTYTYNERGLMNYRYEKVANCREHFSYDNLDRLTKSNFYDENVTQNQNIEYHNNGNIKRNSLVGKYVYYSSFQPNAVCRIDSVVNNVVVGGYCAVTYNFFNQPTEITEGAYRLEIFYGADQQRNKTMIFGLDDLHYKKYYISQYYEKEIDMFNITRHYHYIYGESGAVAVHISRVVPEKSVSDSMYFIHTDHLGSYIALTNASKQVRHRNWFNCWGYASKYDQRGDTIPIGQIATLLTRRGFTGHEHYPWFSIINMNGRLYDPVIARFFSPDNFVQTPEFTQGFNRYSYCLNNPLKYTDPTGQRFVDDLWIRNDDGNNYKYENGKLFNTDGSAYSGTVAGFLKSTVNSLDILRTTNEGKKIIEALQSTNHKFTIVSGDKSDYFTTNAITESGNLLSLEGKITWNSDGTLLPTNGETSRSKYAPTDLGHELSHAFEALNNNGITDKSLFEGLQRTEWNAVFNENLMREQLGQPLRTHYKTIVDQYGTFLRGGLPYMLKNNKPYLPF